ncbi:protein cramped-like [Mya arenaria]|uniref:protein cramped-like n=1 Tax=Mya arenaria TaxID=6604 RepID=UPI0022E08D4B|nr:protein cramped-like [Mya arenaria]
MPPRKRRQSVHGEEVVKESGERQTNSAELSDCLKSVKTEEKSAECIVEKRIVCRQPSKQEPDEQLSVDGESKCSGKTIPAVEGTGKQPTRFSTRIVKRPRRDLSPPESPVKKVGRKLAATSDSVSTTPETKSKRQWELWSVEDKDSFFEGLCEYGKDFESIHNLIVAKCRKKSMAMPLTAVKNKEQVRHFYYRTWHKISKLIQPVEDLKKDIQELYGLISYGVMRKKLRGGVNPNDKNWQKLNDLVHHGAATIKVKGKRIRVKTPVCNALKKLNSYEEPRREPGPKVPEKITVEFRPRSNVAWQHVQDQANNPRVRVTVRPDRHLHSIVKYLEQKWKTTRLKHKEKLNSLEAPSQEFRVYPGKGATLKVVTLEPIDDPVLHFSLNKHCKETTCSPSGGKRKIPKDAPSRQGSVASICTEVPSRSEQCQCADTCNTCSLRNHGDEDSVAGKGIPRTCMCTCNRITDEALCRKSLHLSDRILMNSLTTEVGVFDSVGTDNEDKCDKVTVDATHVEKNNSVTLDAKGHACMSPAVRISSNEVSAIADGENAMFPDSIDTEIVKIDLSSPNSAGTCTSANVSYEEAESEGEGGRKPVSASEINSSHENLKKLFTKMFEKGWSVIDSTDITVAQLYLMFGGEGEVKLEYDWLSLQKEEEALEDELLMTLNNMLRRLSHLATMEITDFSKTTGANMTCQLCGHNPGAKTKPKGRSPTGVAKKSGKDVSCQTLGLQITDFPLHPGALPVTSQNGVFRIPAQPSKSVIPTNTVNVMSAREMIQKYNPVNTNKPFMRRKLKPLRGRGGATQSSLIQRTILPKNSEYIAIIPMVPGTQIPNNPPTSGEGVTQTIIGHPIKGIQSVPVSTVVPGSPVGLSGHSSSISTVCTTLTSSPGSRPLSPNVSFSNISLNGDETLLHIPDSHLGSMSPRSLKAAGMSAVRETRSPASVVMTSVFSSPTRLGHTVSAPVSPPNLSALLDISLTTTDLEGDTTFSSLLGDNSKPQTLDPGLATPPMRLADAETRRHIPLHSPPVRNLFRTSSPEQQWLNGDVQDLSLTSLLDSPCKTSTGGGASGFTTTLPLSIFSDNSRDFHTHKNEVDSSLQCMMQESSIDYSRKFQDLEELVKFDIANEQTTTSSEQHCGETYTMQTGQGGFITVQIGHSGPKTVIEKQVPISEQDPNRNPT